MNYEEAVKLLESKRDIIGQDFIIQRLGIYGTVYTLVIGPKGMGAAVLQEIEVNRIDNYRALEDMNLLKEDLNVIVMGDYKGKSYAQSLEDFLNGKG